MSNYKFINRIYKEEIEKLVKHKPEFDEKGVDVSDFLIALNEMLVEHLDKMETALSELNEEARKQIIEDSQTICSETRKRIDELSAKHLGKRYL